MEEDPSQDIFFLDYAELLRRTGWEITHFVDCPLSTERFRPHIVKRMQKNKMLGVVRRSLLRGRKK